MNFAALVNKLVGSIDNLVSLEIVTAVGEINPTARNPDGTKAPVALHPQAKVMRSRINLLDGNMTTELDPSFVNGSYTELRDFHAAREKQGNELAQANVETLKSILAFAVHLVPHLSTLAGAGGGAAGAGGGAAGAGDKQP